MISINPSELTHEQEGQYLIGLDIEMSDGQRNTSNIEIQILCPLDGLEQIQTQSEVDVFTFEAIEYVADRPVPWIESIFQNGTVDVRFNSTLVLEDAVVPQRRQLKNSFE